MSNPWGKPSCKRPAWCSPAVQAFIGRSRQNDYVGPSRANQTLILTLPSDTLWALKIDAAQLGPEIRMLAAVKLYEMGRLSSGAASHLAGIPRTLFLQKLAEYGVFTFDLTQGELDAETSLA